MRAFYPWTRAVDTDGKRDEASDSPATVKAETFDESELLDIESLPAICLSPTSNRSMSPLSFFTGGGDSAWCSPSRVLIANDPHDIENNNNDCAAASSIAATPLDFSFDSAHGTELYRSSSGQHTEGRAAYVSATAFNCGRDTRGVGLSISCVQGRLLVSAMGDGVFFSTISLFDLYLFVSVCVSVCEDDESPMFQLKLTLPLSVRCQIRPFELEMSWSASMVKAATLS